MEVKKLVEESIRKEAEIERDSWGWKFDGSWIFSSKDEAMKVATGMHKMLQGIDDYIEDRIVLNLDGYTVSLTVYDDATTELEIEDISKHPRITQVKFDAPPEVIASFVGGGR